MSFNISLPKKTSSFIRNISKLSDFPGETMSKIPLESGVEYIIEETLNIGASDPPFSVADGATTTFRGAAFNLPFLNYAGSETLFTSPGNPAFFQIFDISTFGNANATFMDFTGTGSGIEQVAMTQSRIDGYGSIGTLDAIRLLVISCAYTDNRGTFTLTDTPDLRINELIWFNFADRSNNFLTINGTGISSGRITGLTATTLTNEKVFDIDSGIGSSSRIRIEGNSFSNKDRVFATSSLDQKDKKILAFGNVNLRDSRSIGSAIAQGIDVETSISAQGAGVSGYVDFDLDEQTGSITVFANNGSGGTTVTSTAHNMPNERLLEITGTTSYNGQFEIFNVGANTYDIDKAFLADDATGTWTSGAFADVDIERWELNDAATGELKYVGIEDFFGELVATISATTAAASNKRYKFRLVKNGVDGFAIPNVIRNTVTETTFRKGITAITNDLFKLQVANFDGTSNIIIDTVSIGIA